MTNTTISKSIFMQKIGTNFENFNQKQILSTENSEIKLKNKKFIVVSSANNR